MRQVMNVPGTWLRLGAWLLLGACCVALVVVPMALAQTGSEYDLPWWTVDGGGGTWSTGGGYRLSGTAGQPDAGVLEGDGTMLAGGFWRGGEAVIPWHELYFPVVLRQY
jgi:hypothetical protein